MESHTPVKENVINLCKPPKREHDRTYIYLQKGEYDENYLVHIILIQIIPHPKIRGAQF